MSALNGFQRAATLIDDLSWCWWTRPRATVIDDVLYVGGIDSAGGIMVAAVDLASSGAAVHRVASLENDDHNNPAVVAVRDRPLVAFYARHSCDDLLRFRVSTAPLDPASWMPERRLQFGGVTTYAQVHPCGDALHVFTRVGETGWSYRKSPDWAATWGPPTPFIVLDTDQQAYMPTALLADGHTVRVAISGHPKDFEAKPLHQIWTCVVDLGSGEVKLPSQPETIANLASGEGLPLDQHRLELAYAPPPDRTVNVFDVADGDEFEIAFASKRRGDDATRDARYHVSRHYATEWITEDVAPAGTTFGYIPAGFYVGGMSFPHRSAGNRAYVTREDAGVWHLEERRRIDGRWRALPMATPRRERLIRPWAVAGATESCAVLALVPERYDEDYIGTRSRLVGFPSSSAAPGRERSGS